MKKMIFSLVLNLVLLCFSQSTFSQQYINISTGYNHALDKPYSVGMEDQYWKLVSGPVMNLRNTKTTFVVEAYHRGSYATSTGSNWISWQQLINGRTPKGVFQFERCFYLCEKGSITVDLKIWADDEAHLFLKSMETSEEIKIGFGPYHKKATTIKKQIDQLEKGAYCLVAKLVDTHNVAMGLKIEGFVSGEVFSDERCQPKTSFVINDSKVSEIPEQVTFDSLSNLLKLPDSIQLTEKGIPEITAIINNRKIVTQHFVNVKQSKIVLSVSDGVKEDGDVISLLFNGEWILEKYALKKAAKHIEIDINERGDNQLILFAEDMGAILPCTAAVVIDDGKKQSVKLQSNMRTCQAVQLIYQPGLKE